MSTEKTLIIQNGNRQSEMVKGLAEKGWKVIKNTAGCVVLVLSSVEVNAQTNNGVAFINNLPQLTEGQTPLEIVVDGNGGGGFSVEQLNVEGNINADLERWTWNGTTREFDSKTSDGNLIARLSGDKVIAKGISSVGNNPCTTTSGEDEFIGSDFNGNNIDKMVCVMNQVLPVELTKFVAACENDGQQVRFVELKRETASEVNNEGFWVQKSADGKTWDNVAFVKGAGSSSQAKEYGFIDTEGTEGDDDGVVYYRLEQNDFDGQIDYSDVISVRDCDSGIGYDVVISPNPVSDILTVTLKNADNELAHTLYVFNSVGQIVGKVSASDAGKIEFDTSGIPSGIYTIKAIAGNGTDVVTKMFSKI